MNHLANETSPYLLQHASNPVDWYPWGNEAFELSVRLDRPVFLSVGYSACHWCHVMSHESFEDKVTAAALNASFVCIKVDREERPDIDAVYMEAVQAITGSGGWPMSVFLTPDRRPFYGGTYFPPDDRPGSPSFRTALAALTDVWDNRRSDVDEQADELAEAIATRSAIHRGPGAPSVFATFAPGREGGPTDLLMPAADELVERFDPTWGGFGRAPKFPQPTLIDLALRHSVRSSGATAARAEHMAVLTLEAMAAGGIHDHLGGGFARYSTDREWLVPHFEKMLYDQAGLLRAYLHGWQVTGRADFLQVAEGIVEYVGRDLTSAEGGVWSAEDADSEGVEGKFYVWTPAQMAQAVTTGANGTGSGTGTEADAFDVLAAVSEWFGVTESGNFEGSTILRRPLGEPMDRPADVEIGRRLLLEARGARVRPGLDDKVLTEWNAMYGSALAEAAAATGNQAWGDAAVSIGEFLLGHLVGADGRWLRSWQRYGGARHQAYAADHAWLIDCFTRLGELTGQAVWTERAVGAAEALLTLFGDPEGGGFFTTGHDAEKLIVRTKEVFDGATPSANAVAALSLARLGALTGDRRYTDAARQVVEMVGDLLTRHPTAFTHVAHTADLLLHGFTEVVIAGDRPDLLDVTRSRWLPRAVVAWGEPTGSPLWKGRDGSRAFVCRDYVCQTPATDPTTLADQLAQDPS